MSDVTTRLDRLRITAAEAESGWSVLLTPRDGGVELRTEHAVAIDLLLPSGRRRTFTFDYQTVSNDTHGDLLGSVSADLLEDVSVTIVDRWTNLGTDRVRLTRTVSTRAPRARTGLRVRVALSGSGESRSTGSSPWRMFSAGANYNGNDLDEDGVDDYTGSIRHDYRDDRLTSLSVMAYDEVTRNAYSLARSVPPRFDSVPVRPDREHQFLQTTDVGSLGMGHTEDGRGLALSASYPFQESSGFALDLKTLAGWGAYWDISMDPQMSVSYDLSIAPADDFIDAIWNHYTRRMRDLDPTPVTLTRDLAELHALRQESLDKYFVEGGAGGRAAGWALNCHPQDGRQLGDVLQYGFTGQNTLNAWAMLKSDSASTLR